MNIYELSEKYHQVNSTYNNALETLNLYSSLKLDFNKKVISELINSPELAECLINFRIPQIEQAENSNYIDINADTVEENEDDRIRISIRHFPYRNNNKTTVIMRRGVLGVGMPVSIDQVNAIHKVFNDIVAQTTI